MSNDEVAGGGGCFHCYNSSLGMREIILPCLKEEKGNSRDTILLIDTKNFQIFQQKAKKNLRLLLSG